CRWVLSGGVSHRKTRKARSTQTNKYLKKKKNNKKNERKFKGTAPRVQASISLYFMWAGNLEITSLNTCSAKPESTFD
ncbi:hypothetical protein ABTL68_19445, partial [Acinetobacter baumannii]